MNAEPKSETPEREEQTATNRALIRGLIRAVSLCFLIGFPFRLVSTFAPFVFFGRGGSSGAAEVLLSQLLVGLVFWSLLLVFADRIAKVATSLPGQGAIDGVRSYFLMPTAPKTAKDGDANESKPD
jgi:hypothetical protein